MDYAYRFRFAHFDSSIRVTPSANAEVQFCGKFHKLADHYEGDYPCKPYVCPLQCPPGAGGNCG